MISKDILNKLKKDYSNLKIAQWFLDPLNKNGPDFHRNKSRILDKSDFMEANFLTTSPDVLNFLESDRSNLNTHRLATNWRPIWSNFFKEFSNVDFTIYHRHDKIKFPVGKNVNVIAVTEK